jgi:phosphatidylserine decarboxylase
VETPHISASDRRFAALQHALPKHLLSRLIYHVMRIELRPIKQLLLRIFLRFYRVNMAEAEQSDPYAFASFNAFFTRALKPTARPIAPEATSVASPVDGTVSQAGRIEGDTLIQAKGHSYTVGELLGEPTMQHAYAGGSFTCIYLAPYNYHRIHVPIAARLQRTLYIPGDLFSVNAATVRSVPRLFARNERVVCEFETAAGRMAVILVGAFFVGSIELVHCGEVNPPPRARARPQLIATGSHPEFAKGQELGRFNMGSTVILLFERDRLQWSEHLIAETTVRMGERIATLSAPAAGSA